MEVKKLRRETKEKIRKIKEEAKYQKNKEKYDKRNALLNKKGINKFYICFVVESLFLISIELIVKILLGGKAIDISILRIISGSVLISFIINIIVNNLRARRAILTTFNVFVSFYAWLQLGFMNFLGNFMSIGNTGQGTKVIDYISDFLHSYSVKTYYLYIPLGIFLLYEFFERRITRDGFASKINFKSINKVFYLFLALIALGDVFYMSVSSTKFQNKYQAISNKEIFKNPSNPGVAIKNFGTTMYLVLDIKNAVLPKSNDIKLLEKSSSKESETRKLDDTKWLKIDSKEDDDTYSSLNKYFMNREITEKNEYTGMFKDKNVIMIMMESVSEAVFDEKYKDFFPTLNYLHENGITAENNYSPKNNCATGESEMTSQISLYSIETTCTVNAYKNNVYNEALLNKFKNNGYYTSTYHDYNDHYYSRSIYEKNLGAEKYYNIEDFDTEFEDIYSEWPSDYEFMKNILPKFIKKDKFFSYIITVTAHTPYAVSSEYGDKYMSLFDNLNITDPSKRYLSKVKEDDLMLEYLLKTLKKENKLDDTVIVLFGDHYPYALNSDEYQSLASYDIKHNQDTDKTPFIIYNSKTKKEKISKYISPMDYTPTLLNMFDIEFDPRLYMGNDIFSDKEGIVLFPDNSWQNKYGFYNASLGTFIKTSDKKLSDEKIVEINKEVEEMRNMSNLAISSNYFDYLNKRLDSNYVESTTESLSSDEEE